MTNFEMISLFPVPLYVTDIELTEEQRQFIMGVEFENNNIYSLSKDKHILDRPELDSVKNAILHNVDVYNKNGYDIKTKSDIDDFEFYIKTSWVLKTTRGSNYSEHIHSRSVFSGVLYINVDDDSGTINFRREYTNSTMFPYGFTTNTCNDFNGETYWIKPQTKRLVLFPSTLKHYMGESKSDITRYSLAFDVYIKGHMGKGMTGETYYKE